jgi:hypothetical protein
VHMGRKRQSLNFPLPKKFLRKLRKRLVPLRSLPTSYYVCSLRTKPRLLKPTSTNHLMSFCSLCDTVSVCNMLCIWFPSLDTSSVDMTRH